MRYVERSSIETCNLLLTCCHKYRVNTLQAVPQVASVAKMAMSSLCFVTAKGLLRTWWVASCKPFSSRLVVVALASMPINVLVGPTMDMPETMAATIVDTIMMDMGATVGQTVDMIVVAMVMIMMTVV